MFSIGDTAVVKRSGWDSAIGIVIEKPDVKPWATGDVYVVQFSSGDKIAFGSDELGRAG